MNFRVKEKVKSSKKKIELEMDETDRALAMENTFDLRVLEFVSDCIEREGGIGRKRERERRWEIKREFWLT